MKRFIFMLPAALMLCSCSSPISVPVKAPELDISFGADAVISYGGSECSAQIRRLSEGRWEFCVTDPYPLEGLVITVDEGKTKLSMFGMESAADIIPEAISAAQLISGAFEAAVKGDTDAVNTDGVLCLSGQSQWGMFTIGFDENTQPSSLVIDGRDIKVDISGFRELERADDPQAEIE